MEPISFIDKDDRVVVRLLWRVAGRGLETNMEFTGVYSLREGRFFLGLLGITLRPSKRWGWTSRRAEFR